MTGFLLTVGVIGAVVAILGVVLMWRAVRGLRRVLAAGHRRVVEVQTRMLPPGPRRDAADLRIRLAGEVHALQRLMAAAPGIRIFQQDAATVVADLTAFAAALDPMLAAVASAPGREQQKAMLDTVAPQAGHLIDTCATARQTMLRNAALDRERILAALQETVTHEAQALSRYERVDRDLTL